uniref:Uncharacterized protein MANES_05G088300 n=1 Tax=Rhizophora mucronata TaxID=61149 RepID=A0A2P2NZ78_RHIMU
MTRLPFLHAPQRQNSILKIPCKNILLTMYTNHLKKQRGEIIVVKCDTSHIYLRQNLKPTSSGLTSAKMRNVNERFHYNYRQPDEISKPTEKLLLVQGL